MLFLPACQIRWTAMSLYLFPFLIMDWTILCGMLLYQPSKPLKSDQTWNFQKLWSIIKTPKSIGRIPISSSQMKLSHCIAFVVWQNNFCNDFGQQRHVSIQSSVSQENKLYIEFMELIWVIAWSGGARFGRGWSQNERWAGIGGFPTWSQLAAIYLGENSSKTRYSTFMDALHTQNKAHIWIK